MNYQEIEDISKSNMSDMQARIQLSKQNKKSKKGAKSPSL